MTAESTGTEPAALAGTAAEAVRAINHLTLAPPTPGSPGREDVADLYWVLVEVRLLVERLPQALHQLARHLQHQDAHGRCRSDSGTHQTSTELVAEAIGSLQRAGQECCSVGAHLEAAQAAASHLAVLTDDDFEPRALNPRASMEPTGRKEQSR